MNKTQFNLERRIGSLIVRCPHFLLHRKWLVDRIEKIIREEFEEKKKENVFEIDGLFYTTTDNLREFRKSFEKGTKIKQLKGKELQNIEKCKPFAGPGWR